MRNKYYNEAVVGNEKLKVTYTKNGATLPHFSVSPPITL